MKKYSFLLLIISLFLSIPAVNAATTEQSLDGKSSNMKFLLNSPILAFNGEFQDIKGSLKLDSKDFTKSEVKLIVNLGAMTLKASRQGQVIPIRPSLGKLQNQKAIFTSKSIVLNENKSYTISGEIKQGSKKWAMTLIALAIKITDTESKFFIKAEGQVEPGEESSVQSPLAMFAGMGELEAELNFVK